MVRQEVATCAILTKCPVDADERGSVSEHWIAQHRVDSPCATSLAQTGRSTLVVGSFPARPARKFPFSLTLAEQKSCERVTNADSKDSIRNNLITH